MPNADLEQLRTTDPALADAVVEIAKQLETKGLRMKIADTQTAVVPVAPISETGWPTVPPPAPPPTFTPPPAISQETKDQIAARLRSVLSGVGLLLAGLGYAKSDVFGKWVDTNFSVILSVALFIGPQVYSWWRGAQKAILNRYEIRQALHMEPEHRPGVPVTVQEVKRIAVAQFANAKKAGIV